MKRVLVGVLALAGLFGVSGRAVADTLHTIGSGATLSGISEVAEPTICLASSPFSQNPTDYAVTVKVDAAKKQFIETYVFRLIHGKTFQDLSDFEAFEVGKDPIKELTNPALLKSVALLQVTEPVYENQKPITHKHIINAMARCTDGLKGVVICKQVTQEGKIDATTMLKFLTNRMPLNLNWLAPCNNAYLHQSKPMTFQQMFDNGIGDADSDNDGVSDAFDNIAGSRRISGPTIIGATFPSADTDKDGIFDDQDVCPSTKADADVNAQGCSDAQLAAQADDDEDGIIDSKDDCADTPADTEVDDDGCSAAQLAASTDTDEDGVMDDVDECPDVKGVEGKNGCPAEDQKKSDTNTNVAPASDADGGSCSMIPKAKTNPFAFLILGAALIPLTTRRSKA